MKQAAYVFGPVPSRRLGRSLGISPIPKKTCNYSCVYCQLGRTDKMTNTRMEFYPVAEIIGELEDYLRQGEEFDVISIVGEGEPTLYAKLGELINQIHRISDKPVAVITNGALLYDESVQHELLDADFVLPTLDACDEDAFRKINRPHGRLHFADCYQGLVSFSHKYQGQLWLEIMLVKGMNDDPVSLAGLKGLIKNIKYDRIFVNTPIRPPAEQWVMAVDNKTMLEAADYLGGNSIDALVSDSFFSHIDDDEEAIISLIKRHPMNQFEITGFLEARGCRNIETVFAALEVNASIERVDYMGVISYRLK